MTYKTVLRAGRTQANQMEGRELSGTGTGTRRGSQRPCSVRGTGPRLFLHLYKTTAITTRGQAACGQ